MKARRQDEGGNKAAEPPHNHLNSRATGPAARRSFCTTRVIFGKEDSMSRLNAIFIALGSLAIAATPLASSHAQSGDALANAELTCREYGVRAGTAAFDTCVNRAAWAYDRGEPGLATLEAQRVSDPRNICLSYALVQQSMGYRECVATEIDRRGGKAFGLPYAPGSERSGVYHHRHANPG